MKLFNSERRCLRVASMVLSVILKNILTYCNINSLVVLPILLTYSFTLWNSLPDEAVLAKKQGRFIVLAKKFVCNQ